MAAEIPTVPHLAEASASASLLEAENLARVRAILLGDIHAKIAELFGVQRPAITKHLKNIFDTNELQEASVCSILEHTANDDAIKDKTYVQFRTEQDKKMEQ